MPSLLQLIRVHICIWSLDIVNVKKFKIVLIVTFLFLEQMKCENILSSLFYESCLKPSAAIVSLKFWDFILRVRQTNGMLYFRIFPLINSYIQYIFKKILLQLLEVTLKVSEAVWDTSVESEKI